MSDIKKFKPGNFGSKDQTSKVSIGRATSIGGFYEAQAKRICDFAFGAFFFGIEKNKQEFVWVVYLKKEIKVLVEDNTGKDVPTIAIIDPDLVKNFEDYWGNKFRIVLLKPDNPISE